jgi:hypothetical protein
LLPGCIFGGCGTVEEVRQHFFWQGSGERYPGGLQAAFELKLIKVIEAA